MNERVFQYCPRCGAKKFVPKGVKNFHCLDCGFEYYFNPCGATAGFVCDPQGRILVTRRAHDPAAGTLDLPGGFIDFHETAEEALKRELLEELNLKISHLRYICSIPNRYEYSGVLYHTIDLLFLCRAENIQAIRIGEELTGYHFLPIEEIDLREVGFASIRRGLEYLREQIQCGEIRL